MNTEQEIYGWHIIHAPTGLPYAFCSREIGGTVLTEDDVLDVLDPELFVLVPLVRAGRLQPPRFSISTRHPEAVVA